MTNNIIEQVKLAMRGFAIGYFHTSGCFSTPYQEEYYKYFGDSDFETRKSAIAAFTCMLGTWETAYCTVFVPIKEWEENKRWGRQPAEEKRFYRFNDYLNALIEHHENIEQEFPIMFEFIVSLLIKIEKNKGISYEEWFPELDPQLFYRVRHEILIPKKYLAENRNRVKYLLEEIGIESFLKSDL